MRAIQQPSLQDRRVMIRSAPQQPAPRQPPIRPHLDVQLDPPLAQAGAQGIDAQPIRRLLAVGDDDENAFHPALGGMIAAQEDRVGAPLAP